MPTVVKGKDSYVTFRGLNIGSALANDASLSMTGTDMDASTFGSNWKSSRQGQSEGALSVKGVWDAGTAALALDSVLFAAINGGGTSLWEYMPQGSVSGQILYKGNGVPTSYNISSPIGGVVGFDLTVKCADAPARSIAG